MDIIVLAVINAIGLCPIASQNVKILQGARGALAIQKDFGIILQKILVNPILVTTGVATIFVSRLAVMMKNIRHNLYVKTQATV
ncbi:hypothetical protein HYY70_02985 [Candidatus Woesearchaeota archaeon]|nr:hypothetical protein [Candidatus Woesearchaeota archaeon]